MALTLDILVFIHLMALSLGGAASFGIPVVSAAMARAAPEHKPALVGAMRPLRLFGMVALTVLILTGLAAAWLQGTASGAPVWFWLKMIAVAALTVGIFTSLRLGSRAMKGDAAAGATARRLAPVNIALLALVVLFAVLAFA